VVIALWLGNASHAVLGALVPGGQHLKEFGELGLAFVLSSLIGLEREWRQKSAGLRTNALVGTGAALFLLVSKYGFGDIVLGKVVVLDPSRVAAQIVSGIGFIGGGLIFVRGDAVRGLTTAAVVWVTAAVGMAAGAGLPLLAVAATAGHFIIVFVFPVLTKRLPPSRHLRFGLRVLYEDGRGILRGVLNKATELGFAIVQVRTDQLSGEVRGVPAVALMLEVRGQPRIDPLMSALDELDGVLEVSSTEPSDSSE
jgi:putative Mg2+ transporter-C (MgtC) family protein